jgi:hypothetical protein
MIDIETMSRANNAAVISIGACTFDSNGIHDTFKVNIKPESAKAFGMRIDKDTIDWWMKQSVEVRNASLTRNVMADFGLKQFADWVKSHKPSKVWAQGVTFDMVILENAFISVKVDQPWKFYDVCDSRTLLEMFGIRTTDLHAKAGSNHHDALDDAKIQAQAVVTVLNALGWSEVDGPIKF